LRGEPVDLNGIACPLLLLAAKQDHLVPPSATFGLAAHVRSNEIEQMSIPVGHVGLAVSSKAHQNCWPAAADWLAKHSTPLPAA
jgi:polyhydroxyalkanoate synthase